MLKTPLGRFRAVSLSEGVSFLLLLGIAMPLKYGANMPEAVFYVGWAHGILFVLFVAALLLVSLADGWGRGKTALGFIAGVLPFGPFVFDYWITRKPEPVGESDPA